MGGKSGPLDGASGKRYQEMVAIPSVPGSTTDGTDVLFSGYWDGW